tara:strand:+ start:406 stop:1029 length:624 start_codon:yes stop_codon:yes gene_type:complete
MEDQWLTWAKRLQAIASTGLHFGASDFDKERYQDVHDIANEMLATLGQVPIRTILDLVPDTAEGYATPKIDVRGAVFKANKILLVKEKLDGLWTLPGGYADVCISPSENVEKEIQEEANISVKAERLYGLVHKARHEYDMDARDFYKLFFLCRQTDTAAPCAGAETLDADYFALDQLPPLSTGRVIEKHIHLAAEYLENPGRPPEFD